MPERIAVALSGGVDSAVVAALLKEQGHDVVALTMLLQKQDQPDDAVRVAQVLGIEHHIIDMTGRFAAEVMQPFAASYALGETPVPCALCNRHIKFGALMDKARELGAQAMATGHYVRSVETAEGVQLHKGADLQKDQSYFLFDLSHEQIGFARFPLGELNKGDTRGLAERFALPVARKKDSQDICFVPCGDYASVVEKLRPEALKSGDIVDQQGHVLGRHEGIIHFTVGQRKGLSLSDRKGDHNEPLFVLALDAVKQRVVVGGREALARSTVYLRDVNWLGERLNPASTEVQEVEVQVRLRSSQQPVPARFVMRQDGMGQLTLAGPTNGVAKGQAGVMYQGSRLVGGGWICGAE